MHKTPSHLLKYGIEAELPSGKVWRGHWAMRRESGFKKEYLSTMCAMEMARALPQFGAKAKHVHRVTQKLLGAMQGITRETVNRRISAMAPASDWSEERRASHAERMRSAAAAQGKKLHARERRSLRHIGDFLKRSRGWGEANLYTLLPASVRPEHTKGIGSQGDPTAHARLLAEHYGTELYDPQARVNGFKEIEGLIWHPRLPDPQECSCTAGQATLDPQQPCPHCGGSGTVFRGSLPDFARLLATHLEMKGIKDEIRDGNGKVVKPRNVLVITQQQLAQELDMHVNTIAKCERKLEALMFIRIVPGEVHRDESGAVTSRDPHKILWILDKLMDEAIAESESTRFANACRAAQQRGADPLAIQRAQQVFGDLLHSWTGKEHSLQAFYNEMRRRLASAGVHRELSGALFPLAKE